MKYKIVFRFIDTPCKQLHIVPVHREHEVRYNAHWGKEFGSVSEALAQVGEFNWDAIQIWNDHKKDGK